MNVSSIEQGMYGSTVEIADIRKGGNSGWGEKQHDKESSIRLRWSNEKGGYDPISSSELPMWGLKLLTEAAAKHDLLSPKDIVAIISALNNSLDRQL